MTSNSWIVTTAELSTEAYVQIYGLRSEINSVAAQLGVSALSIAACLSEEVQDQLNLWALKGAFVNGLVDGFTGNRVSHSDLLAEYNTLRGLSLSFR